MSRLPLRPGHLFRPANLEGLGSALWRSLRDRRRATAGPRPGTRHLEAALAWIEAAHDASADGGLPSHFDALRGWAPSYPETTGYLIPTLLRVAGRRGGPSLRDRALRMADWECQVQLDSGAVRSGHVEREVGPSVFCTGQVLFGWEAAYRETGRARYEASLRRAAEWLVRIQEPDGSWRRHLSLLTTSPVHAFNVRSAWGLARAGALLDEPAWVEAATRNFDWATERQTATGWFRDCSFETGRAPLLHTIAYTLEGLLGAAELTGRAAYRRAVLRGVRPLVASLDRHGRTFGRYRGDWRPAAPSRCVTGDAQLALVLLRLLETTEETEETDETEGTDGTEGLADAAGRLVRSVCAVQDLTPARPGYTGGVPGSWPVWGGYMTLKYPSWAVKFHLDALMAWERHAG